MYLSASVLVQVLSVCLLAAFSSCSGVDEKNKAHIRLTKHAYADHSSEAHGITNNQAVQRKTSKDCVCGTVSKNTWNSYIAPRIVNGSRLMETDHPYLALLKTYDGQFQCGGSIINLNYVLTAAHCVRYISSSDLQVELGVHDRRNGKHQQKYNVKKILRHPEAYINDIALLQLDKPITFNKYVQPICLPETESSKYSTAFVEGWGHTRFSGVSSNTPLQAKVRVISWEECAPSFGSKVNQATQICASGKHSEACNTDSGGPLYVNTENGHRVLIGITSRGIQCEPPTVYTKVEAYMDWIAENTLDAEFCSPP